MKGPQGCVHVLARVRAQLGPARGLASEAHRQTACCYFPRFGVIRIFSITYFVCIKPSHRDLEE
ncbi:hypothetical protein I79_005425 [Cricetulus griseus]|uniref:Uncharacterized protein n=1 Tax=Cricetulus griseus TaxID=10029 RepID=G3H554_CRIGR|nr:hypothetical protein I79_005425 [Cricetulus griseus]